MKTQRPEKRVSRKSKDEFYDYDYLPKKSKARKPKRGRKDFFYDEDGEDQYDDDSY
ncbi:MAG: hypothetical protein PWR01_4179 [Clostridiales bacterium]|nr:hypothetical protein [Clostridiales bacterium]MDN5283106.1 hypothetical protein [Candidatus Ozemobacter sp.]